MRLVGPAVVAVVPVVAGLAARSELLILALLEDFFVEGVHILTWFDVAPGVVSILLSVYYVELGVVTTTCTRNAD